MSATQAQNLLQADTTVVAHITPGILHFIEQQRITVYTNI